MSLTDPVLTGPGAGRTRSYGGGSAAELKIVGEDTMMIDVMLAHKDGHTRMIENALHSDSPEGTVRLIGRKDLIELKRARNSKLDQADIERLEHE